MINDPNPGFFQVWGVTPAPKSVKDDSVQGGRSVHVPTTGSGNKTKSFGCVRLPVSKNVTLHISVGIERSLS